MAKVLVPTSSCAGIDADGKRYRADKSGKIDVPDHLVKRLLKHGECFLPAQQPVGASGFLCESCGFHGFFRKCGKCGGVSHRPTEKV